jgi:hypothetical protein
VHILIDECLPRELGDELIGHDVTTVQEAGWAGFRNGQLLKKISGTFETFITIDKRIENEHKIPGNVALITVRAPSNRIQDLRPLVPELLQAIKTTKPGRSTRVGRITRR